MLWLKFNTVGALGAGVQAAALWLLMKVFRVHYLIATPIAVEAAILHNFAWHFHWTFNNQRWTFADQGSVRMDFTNVAPLLLETAAGSAHSAGSNLARALSPSRKIC
ncbi:MAG: GtrA family protein [Acidobacteria bacterium]|nr:GtrA family protein [Acidobacteriota bacterium]